MQAYCGIRVSGKCAGLIGLKRSIEAARLSFLSEAAWKDSLLRKVRTRSAGPSKG